MKGMKETRARRKKGTNTQVSGEEVGSLVRMLLDRPRWGGASA